MACAVRFVSSTRTMAFVASRAASAVRLPAARVLMGTSLGGAALAGLVHTSCNGPVEDAAKDPKCRPVVLCGPSGVGKSTLITMLRKEFPEDFGFSVSHTTRGPRPGEKDGIDYYFVEKSAMEKEITAGKFLETAHVHGNIYGTSFEAVDRVSANDKICILDIDIQGVKSCKTVGFDADSYIFVAPPTLAELEKRLRGRGTETEDKIQKRLSNAVGEVDAAKEIKWDGYIVNDDIDKAYGSLKSLTEKARHQRALALAKKAA